MKHLFLWGSAGTGKTLLLIEWLRIMIARAKLKIPEHEPEVHVLVYHEHVNESSEIMKDLEEKYLPSLNSDGNVKPKTFLQLCNGKFSNCVLEI